MNQKDWPSALVFADSYLLSVILQAPGKGLPPLCISQNAFSISLLRFGIAFRGQSHNEGPKIAMDAQEFGIAHNKLFLASVLLLVLFHLPGISSLCPYFLYADPLRASSSISCPRGCCNWFLLVARNRLTQTSSNKGWWGMGVARRKVEAIRRTDSCTARRRPITTCFYSLSSHGD